MYSDPTSIGIKLAKINRLNFGAKTYSLSYADKIEGSWRYTSSYFEESPARRKADIDYHMYRLSNMYIKSANDISALEHRGLRTKYKSKLNSATGDALKNWKMVSHEKNAPRVP